MKRWLTILLALMLLLGGCKENAGNNTTALPTTAPPTEPGLYNADHPIGTQTDGVVRVYPLDFSGSVSAAFMGEDLLIFSNDEDSTTITRLSGGTCAVKQKLELDQLLSLNDGSVRLTDQKFVYYDDQTKELVVYDSTLTQSERLALPQDMQGKPVLTQDLTAVYYTTGEELRQYDLTGGISRLIRQQQGWKQRIDNVLCNGTVLYCYTEEPNVAGYYEFVSAQTGRTLAADKRMEYALTTSQRQYALQRSESLVTEVVFGEAGAPTKDLVIDRPDSLLPVMPMGAVAAVQTETELVLSYYDLDSGKRESEITLQGVTAPYAAVADPTGEAVWLLCRDESEAELLCKWDITAADPGDEAVYTVAHATLETPDAQSIAGCRARADALQEAYGVKIFFGTDFAQPGDHTLVYEYQARPIDKGLTLLEESLKAYPEGFLQSIAAVSDSGAIHIGLVRDIVGGPVDAKGLQYWADGNAHIALVIDAALPQALPYEVCHVTDAFVNAKHGMYDTWNQLNPAEFVYYNNDTDYANHQDMTLVEGDTKAFIDLYSLSYAREDRASIFAHAMRAENQGQFASAAMQAKLNYLCRAIRQALSWQEDTRILPWEQYLAQPIAPQPAQ